MISLPDRIRSKVRGNNIYPLPIYLSSQFFMRGIYVSFNEVNTNVIRGARVYYLRNILHDWSDQKCIEILASVKPSMTADRSVLLIDEIVLPEKGAPWRAAQLDMEMLVHLAGAERTEKEWRKLLDAAGFKVKRIRQYSLDRGEGVIEAVLK